MRTRSLLFSFTHIVHSVPHSIFSHLLRYFVPRSLFPSAPFPTFLSSFVCVIAPRIPYCTPFFYVWIQVGEANTYKSTETASFALFLRAGKDLRYISTDAAVSSSWAVLSLHSSSFWCAALTATSAFLPFPALSALTVTCPFKSFALLSFLLPWSVLRLPRPSSQLVASKGHPEEEVLLIGIPEFKGRPGHSLVKEGGLKACKNCGRAGPKNTKCTLNTPEAKTLFCPSQAHKTGIVLCGMYSAELPDGG